MVSLELEILLMSCYPSSDIQNLTKLKHLPYASVPTTNLTMQILCFLSVLLFVKFTYISRGCGLLVIWDDFLHVIFDLSCFIFSVLSHHSVTLMHGAFIEVCVDQTIINNCVTCTLVQYNFWSVKIYNLTGMWSLANLNFLLRSSDLVPS